jgi:hypothetical protein
VLLARISFLMVALVALCGFGCKEQSKESKCAEAREKMLSLASDYGIPASDTFCRDYMSNLEVKCMLKASTTEGFLACFPQSYEEGLRVICEAPDEATLSGVTEEDNTAVTTYIATNLRNKRAAELFYALDAQSPLSRVDTLNEQAMSQEFGKCALADYLRENP